MEQQFTYEVLEKLKRKKRKTIWKQILRVMMCMVVFCTTYMLILPAITKEARTFCGHEEHTHEAACYQEAMVCQEHVHTEVCFPENGGPSCVLPGHTHTVACQGQILICGKEEHTHLQSCFSDVTADTETEEDWMATLPQITGISKENLLAIAVSQLDYSESALNYIVDSNGQLKGYTRYGAWHGDPYGDWSGMFVAFCLRYTGVELPYDPVSATWAEMLREQNLFYIPSEHIPEAGDLVFLDQDGDGIIDHMGLAETLEDIQLTTIEGDFENRVVRNTYDLFDPRIIGYGIVDIPKTLMSAEVKEEETEIEEEKENEEAIEEENKEEEESEGAWAELIYPETQKGNTRRLFSASRTAASSTWAARAAPLDLEPYINTVNMYDSKGNLIPSGSMVTEGDLIEFKIEYTITGQQLAVMNGNTITVKSDTLLYTLPKIFEMVQSDSGNILNSSGQIVGEYMIDSETGTITMRFDENYVMQNAKGIQIHGYISCFSTVKKVTNLDDEHQDFEFTDGIVLGVTIEKKDEAIGDLSIEKEKVSVDGEELVYQVRVTSKEGTTGPVTLTDEMSAGLTFTRGVGVWDKNGAVVNTATFSPSSDRSAFTMTLPEMAPGDSYVVQYRCNADIDLLGGDMTVRNDATVSSKDSHDKEIKDRTTVEHHFDVLTKTGIENDDGTITWTITINQAKADISGWILEDTLGGVPYTGPVTIKDDSGNVLYQNVRLPVTFPQGSTDTYVITYITKHTIAEGDIIYNKANLRDNDTSVTVVTGVNIGTPITKTGEAGTVIEDENGQFLLPITWTVTIDTANSSIAAGQYFYDQMNGAYHTAELFMTYDQLMAALRNMETELTRVGSASGDITVVRYAEGYSTGQTLTLAALEQDPNRSSYLFERFSVWLSKDVPQGHLLTFTYETYGTFPNNVVADREYKNCFNISQHYEVEGLVKFSSGTLKATKSALSYYNPSIPNQKWHWGNTDWGGVEGTSYFEYEKLHDSYLAWSIELSIPPGYSNTDDFVIYEDLPDGVSVRKLGVPFFSDQPIPYLELADIELGQTYYWTFMIHPVEEYDKWHASQRNDGFYTTITIKVTEDGDLEMTLPGDLLRLMGNLAKRYSQPEWYAYLYIYTQINDDFQWTPQAPGSRVYVNSFQNRFTIKSEDGEVIDVGSQNQVITKDESKGMIRKVASTDDNNIINYSVVLNAYGKDLMGDSGYVAVHDELTYTSIPTDPLRVRLVPGSVTLSAIRLASDGSYTKLRDVTPDYSYNEASSAEGEVTTWIHTIDMVVPDGTTLLLEYAYKVSGDENAFHEVLNKCTIRGVGEGFLDGDHKLEIEVKDATAQADTKGIMLYKVDADSDGIFLEKARFNIYIWNEEANDYIIVHHPDNGSADFMTDVNGMIVIDGSTVDLDQFAYNTAYYIVEVESPEGYFLGPEPYYFYIVHENTEAYPPCLPDGFTGRPLTSGDIIYRKNINELTKIRVEKFWQDQNGNPVTVTGQEVTSVTLELWQMLQGDPRSAKRYGTYTMTPDEDGNWSLTITGLPKATRNADGTKGTDYLYYIKELTSNGYALESAENNAGINTGTIKLVNRKTEGYVLPETGGIGTQMYTTAGLLMVLISAAFLVYNHRKSRREASNTS